MRLFSIIILGLFACLKSQADCWSDFKIKTQQQMHQREKLYRSLDSNFKEMTDLTRAYTADGTKPELVMLIHGFLASPNEMHSIADMVNQAGYPVYSALIPGYGATAKVANQFKKSDWVTWSESEIARAEKCFSKIHFIGFSTGGTLFHDYVTKNPNDKKISSLTLISPFFKTHFTFNLILKLIRLSHAKEVHMSAFFKHISVSDVQVILDTPETYLQVAPILSLFEVVALGKENKNRKIKKKSLTIPTLAVISLEDMVADHDTSEKLLKYNFKNLQMQTYEDPGHVPHQLMATSVSRVADDVHRVIFDFLQKN